MFQKIIIFISNNLIDESGSGGRRRDSRRLKKIRLRLQVDICKLYGKSDIYIKLNYSTNITY